MNTVEIQEAKRKREYHKKYRQEHPSLYHDANRKWYQSERGKLVHFADRLKRRFNLTVEQYQRMFELQKGLCAICHNPSLKKRLTVDHDHSTGKVCALLCEKCNRGLGLFNDSSDLMLQASNYLAEV